MTNPPDGGVDRSRSPSPEIAGTAGQLLLKLLRGFPATPADLSSDEIIAAAWRLGRASGRAHPMTAFCRAFLLAHGNCNYDLTTNGEARVLCKLAPFAPSVIFDVGANVGNWLAAALSRLPGAHAHAFEIVQDTFVRLQHRFAGRREVTANAFGLSDFTGELEIYLFANEDELASYVPYPHGSYTRRMCPVLLGDEYVRQHAIDRIDLLKLDVEGAEHLVLKGLSQTIDSGRIDVIQFEYGKINILTHFLLFDFYDFLDRKGFTVGKIYPDRVDFRPYALEDEDFIGPNYLAVRNARSDIIDAVRGKP